MRNILRVEADIKGQRRVPGYIVTQNDSVSIIVTVLDGGSPVNLDEVSTMTIACTRRDGRVVVKAGTQSGPSEITFELGTTEIELTGKVDAVVQLYSADGRVSTIKFAFNVTKDPTGEGYVPSEDERTLIEVVIGDGPLVIERAETAATFIEDKRPLIEKFTDEQTNLQAQLDEVARGATNAETSQARVDAKGESHATLKARLDAEYTKVTRFLQDFLVNVKMFGAKGDGVSDDTDAINNAFTFAYKYGGTVYFPKSNYLITNHIGLPSGISGSLNVKVLGAEGSKIICNPAERLVAALNIQTSNLQSAIISGIEIDCSLKTAAAIFVRSTTEPMKLAVVNNCNVYNMHGVSAGTAAGTNVTGIFVQSTDGGGIADIRNNRVNGVTRSVYTLNGGSYFCSGISVTYFRNVVVDNNYVEKVLNNPENKLDADGIKIFSSVKSGAKYERSTIQVQNNTVVDCSGRFVKLQTNGKVSVKGNNFEIKGAIELIPEYAAIDSQTGNADIEDNHFYFGDTWTGAASGKLCALQSPSDYEFSGENFFQSFSRNKGIFKKELIYGVIPSFSKLDTMSVKVHYKVVENEFHTTDYFNSNIQIGAGSRAITNFIYNNNVTNILGNVLLEIRGNKIHSYEFLRLIMRSSDRGVDLTDKLVLIVQDNIKFPFGYSRSIIYPETDETARVKTSSIRVSGNQIGGSVSAWHNPFDILKIMEGTCMSVEAGTSITNRPTGFATGVVSREGRYLICKSDTGIWHGTTAGSWRRVNLEVI